jgi:hypothetical protein
VLKSARFTVKSRLKHRYGRQMCSVNLESPQKNRPMLKKEIKVGPGASNQKASKSDQGEGAEIRSSDLRLLKLKADALSHSGTTANLAVCPP